MFNVVRQVASSFGVALLATVLTRRLLSHDAVLERPGHRPEPSSRSTTRSSSAASSSCSASPQHR